MYILIIHTYVFCQVFPFWIKVIYQRFFPIPMPLFQLLFSMNSYIKSFVYLVINQHLQVITIRETCINV